MAPFYTNNFDLAPVGLYAPGAMFQGWSVAEQPGGCPGRLHLPLPEQPHAGAPGRRGVQFAAHHQLAAAANSNPYTLTYRVNHLPWLEGMVTWWPLDVDGSDIFGGLNGLLLGDVAVLDRRNHRCSSTTSPAPFESDVAGRLCPNAGNGGSALPTSKTYIGAPNYSFGTLGTNTVMRLTNTLSPQQRCGWSSAPLSMARASATRSRFNTLKQGPAISTRRLHRNLAFWMRPIPTATTWSLLTGHQRQLPGAAWPAAASTTAYQHASRSATRTTRGIAWCWPARPDQNVRASRARRQRQLSWSGRLRPRRVGFQLGLQDSVSPNSWVTPPERQPVDVAVDYARLTTGCPAKSTRPISAMGWPRG